MRPILIIRTFSILFLYLLSATAHAEEERPNILLLMAEDMSSRVGAFEDPVAVTPNIDQLAAEGVRYTNVFTAAGVCAPSRAAVILGMHQIATGSQHMRTGSRPEGGYKSVPPAYAKAFPELLRKAGYFTFTDMKLDYQFSGAIAGTGPFTIWDEEFVDLVDAEDDVWEKLESGDPFFGFVNFMVTHESRLHPPLGALPKSGGHLMSQVMVALTGGRGEEQVVTPEDIILEPYYPDVEAIRNDIAQHYNNIAEMDRQVGQIRQNLKQKGVLDNTIILWTTDHGDGLPRSKREVYHSGTKVPLVLWMPEKYRAKGWVSGSVRDHVVSFIDLAPTILEWAGADRPDWLHGENFISPDSRTSRYAFSSRDRIDEVMDRRRAITDGRFTYIRNWYPDQPTGHPLAYRDILDSMDALWAGHQKGTLDAIQSLWFEGTGSEQFFDSQFDPHQVDNLIDDDRYSEQIAEMRTALNEWLKTIGDTSNQPEAEMVETFNPQSTVPTTNTPLMTYQDGKLVITVKDQASIGYRMNGEDWRLYTAPLEVKEGDTVIAKAIRYGWEESEEIEIDF